MKKPTIKKLVLELCKREGKKKQVNVAQMTEIVGHVADILFKYPVVIKILISLAERRERKNKK